MPPGSGAFPYFAAAQNGLSSALCTCLLINGFVGFQLYEDGTTLSVWLLRLCSVGMFIISGAVSLLTFKGWAGLGPDNTIGLFVVLYLLNAIFLFVYVVLQLMLVVNTLQDRWPLGHIIFGVFFFVIGQVILYLLNDTICEGAAHYLDGLFFATICNLLGVMMVYKVRSSWSIIQLLSVHLAIADSNRLYSTGIPSPRRILSSVLASKLTLGRSRSYSPRRTARPATSIRTTPACTSPTTVTRMRATNCEACCLCFLSCGGYATCSYEVLTRCMIRRLW